MPTIELILYIIMIWVCMIAGVYSGGMGIISISHWRNVKTPQLKRHAFTSVVLFIPSSIILFYWMAHFINKILGG